jgi:anti-anti-sigma regulatory factor
MAVPSRRRVEISEIGEEVVVKLTDKQILTSETIGALGTEFNEIADKFRQRKILLDFGNVEYFAAAAIGKLITFNKKVDAAGGQLMLCNMVPPTKFLRKRISASSSKYGD